MHLDLPTTPSLLFVFHFLSLPQLASAIRWGCRSILQSGSSCNPCCSRCGASGPNGQYYSIESSSVCTLGVLFICTQVNHDLTLPPISLPPPSLHPTSQTTKLQWYSVFAKTDVLEEIHRLRIVASTLMAPNPKQKPAQGKQHQHHPPPPPPPPKKI